MDKAKFQDDVLNTIVTFDPCAISFLASELRDKGWKGLGNLYKFANTLQENGFTLKRKKKPNGDIIATYVTVE